MASYLICRPSELRRWRRERGGKKSLHVNTGISLLCCLLTDRNIVFASLASLSLGEGDKKKKEQPFCLRVWFL